MSVIEPGTEVKMAGNSSFVGTLKRLFKPSRREEDGARTSGDGLPVETPKLSHLFTFSAKRDSLDLQTCESHVGNEFYGSRFSSRKAVSRKVLTSSSGPLAATSSHRSISGAQAS